MTAREEFNNMLNSCACPRTMYDTLMGLALSIAKQKPNNPREALLEALKEGGLQDERRA